jgi:hypothetical protein
MMLRLGLSAWLHVLLKLLLLLVEAGDDQQRAGCLLGSGEGLHGVCGVPA